MKAVVLTCDKYMPFADHTIQTYEKLWKNNYFTYRVPYNNNYPQSIKKRLNQSKNTESINKIFNQKEKVGPHGPPRGPMGTDIS